MEKKMNKDAIIMNSERLPIIIGDTGTHFQIYNPRNLYTYFVDKEDFFDLAMGKPLKTLPKSYHYKGIDRDRLNRMNEFMHLFDEYYFELRKENDDGKENEEA